MKKTEEISGEIDPAKHLKITAEVSCFLCSGTNTLEMPKYATQNSFRCTFCNYETTASNDACCVFCEHGNTICPPQQRRALYFSRLKSIKENPGTRV